MKVSYFILSVDGRRKTFYVATDPYYLTFGFRNMFNALEYVDVVGTVTRLTAYERAMAMCSGKAQQYDRTVARTYEVQTGPLTDGQVRELEQLIGSGSVRLCAGSADYEVIVTDHTLEISNDDSTLPTVKFTFRFAGDRPRLLSSELGSLMLSGSRIFSKEFSPEFS